MTNLLLQFTLFLNYLLLYVVNLTSLTFLLNKFPIIATIVKITPQQLLLILKRYSSYSILILLIIASLSGLPPFGLFFIKLSILIIIFNTNCCFISIMLFAIYLINMFFYLQLFIFRKQSQVSWILTYDYLQFKFFNNFFEKKKSNHRLILIRFIIIGLVLNLLYSVLFLDVFLINI